MTRRIIMILLLFLMIPLIYGQRTGNGKGLPYNEAVKKETSVPLCADSIVIVASNNGSMDTYSGENMYLSQSFSITDCYITGVRVMYKAIAGNPDLDIRMNVYTAVADKPVTKVCSSTNIFDGPWPGARYVLFLFDNNYLATGNYCFVTSYENIVTHNDANYVSFGIKSGNPFASGKFSYSLGGVWTVLDDWDMQGSVIYDETCP